MCKAKIAELWNICALVYGSPLSNLIHATQNQIRSREAHYRQCHGAYKSMEVKEGSGRPNIEIFVCMPYSLEYFMYYSNTHLQLLSCESATFGFIVIVCMYSKTCVKRPLSKRPKIGFQDQLSLNARQKYCRILQLLTFITLLFCHYFFVLSNFEFEVAVLHRFYCIFNRKGKQCGSWSDGFDWSQLILIYIVFR